MTHDDAHTSHNHGFALPAAPQVVVRNESRPWRVVAGVALCLGLAGTVAGLIVARRQSLSDQHLISDALQREELRDGWRALGAAAAQEAQANAAQANTAAQASPTESVAAAPPNVVIVNVPPQSAAPAPYVAASAVPSHVTNVNLASGSPNQSLPPINLSPAPGYVPMQPGFTLAPASDTTQTNALPQYSYGTATTTGVPLQSTPVGNGSIPGSSPNSALPNNGLVGSSPVPGVPNVPASGSLTPSGSSVP